MEPPYTLIGPTTQAHNENCDFYYERTGMKIKISVGLLALKHLLTQFNGTQPIC